MRNLTFSFLVVVLYLGCASCSDKQYQALFVQRNSMTGGAAQQAAADTQKYRIKPQDILQVRNLQNIKYIVDETPVSPNTGGGGSGSGANNQQGQTYLVEDDGTVALPVIGHIKVAGLTRFEAQKFIEGLYHKSLLKDPIIELKIVNLKVTVLGEVKAQGNFSLTKDKTTLIEIIGQAGGLTDKANEKNIKIIRGPADNPQVTEINLSILQTANDPKTLLQNGDVIYVSKNKRAVHSDNFQNFSVIIQPVLLVVNTVLIIFTLTRR